MNAFLVEELGWLQRELVRMPKGSGHFCVLIKVPLLKPRKLGCDTINLSLVARETPDASI